MTTQDMTRHVLRVVAKALTIAGLACCSCDAPTEVETCADLGTKLEEKLEARCLAEPKLPSEYCSTCVAARLFSYTKAGNGLCICAPLTLTDKACASVDDPGKITAAIVAADAECAEYRLGRATGGSGGTGGGAAGTGGALSEGGSSGAGGSDAPPISGAAGDNAAPT
jgi:uncharacterized membrane protein YgcG